MGNLKTGKQLNNNIDIVNKCSMAIINQLNIDPQIAGFYQRIIISKGEYYKHPKIDVTLKGFGLNSIQAKVREALNESKRLNRVWKPKLGENYCGFLLSFNITSDRGNYGFLEEIDFTKSNITNEN